MKALVETIGDILLLTPRNEVVHFDRPAVIFNSNWIEAQISLLQLKLITLLPAEATDGDWVKHLKACEGDMELAIDSYKAMFEPVPIVKVEPVKVSLPVVPVAQTGK